MPARTKRRIRPRSQDQNVWRLWHGMGGSSPTNGLWMAIGVRIYGTFAVSEIFIGTIGTTWCITHSVKLAVLLTEWAKIASAVK
jgi:hypothetical protein